jgi:hypothetical protein
MTSNKVCRFERYNQTHKLTTCTCLFLINNLFKNAVMIQVKFWLTTENREERATINRFNSAIFVYMSQTTT